MSPCGRLLLCCILNAMKEVYLMTGAGGYLGRAAVEALLHRGCRVRALVHSPQGAANLPAGAEAVPGSVLEPASLQALFSVPGEPPLCCIHAAGLISVNRRDPQVRLVNVEGTKNILELCQARMARLVYVSSVDALCLPERNEPVREPQRFFPEKLSTEYGRSKAESANMVLEAAKGGLSASVVLPSCILGPGDARRGFTSIMLQAYLRGIPPVSITGGYDFVDVRDVAQGILAACLTPGGSVYLLTGRYGSVKEVFDCLADYTGRPRTRLTLPLELLYPALPFVSLYGAVTRRRMPLSSSALKLLAAHPLYDHSRATRELGFMPRPLEETVRDTAAFLLGRSVRS